MPDARASYSRILLVEDNADDEALTLRALRKQDVPNEVVVVRDGAEALDYLFCTGAYVGRHRKDLPRLMLLDLKLPKIDGLEVLRRVRADPRTRLIPIVIFTSSTEERDLTAGYGYGANSYVAKPIDSAQFESVLSDLGRYWLSVNQQPDGPIHRRP
ncbi:MAG: response regulator [Chloroflexi bacterium]|nr:response regulator [Chloroflexota bacterium]